MHCARFADAYARDKAGSSNAASVAMMASATNNSINVKPLWVRLFQFTVLQTVNGALAHAGLTAHKALALPAAGLAASLLLCSCATPYRPLKHHSGYTERQLGANAYEVCFYGNANTSWDQGLDFALLRAAEIALSRQTKSFILLDIINLSSARRYLVPGQYWWTASPYLSTWGQSVPSAPEFAAGERGYRMMSPPEERIFYKPAVKLRVLLPPGAAPGHIPYDAAEIAERIKRKYGLRS